MSTIDASPALRLEAVQAGYGDLRVLHGIDLVVPQGQVTAVLGPNGAGKTTLIRTIAGQLPARQGVIEFMGEPVQDVPTHARLRNIGWVPEGRMLFGDYSIRDNLLLSARAAGSREDAESAVADCIELFPVLGDRLRMRAGNLSGGQQQMVAIARAIVRRPLLLLLDEPSMGLAPLVLEDIRQALVELKSRGMSVLVTEQNVPWLTDVIDHVVVLNQGTVRLRGHRDLLADRDAMRTIYLGA